MRDAFHVRSQNRVAEPGKNPPRTPLGTLRAGPAKTLIAMASSSLYLRTPLLEEKRKRKRKGEGRRRAANSEFLVCLNAGVRGPR